jgi:hypothetical protein
MDSCFFCFGFLLLGRDLLSWSLRGICCRVFCTRGAFRHAANKGCGCQQLERKNKEGCELEQVCVFLLPIPRILGEFEMVWSGSSCSNLLNDYEKPYKLSQFDDQMKWLHTTTLAFAKGEESTKLIYKGEELKTRGRNQKFLPLTALGSRLGLGTRLGYDGPLPMQGGGGSQIWNHSSLCFRFFELLGDIPSN